MSYRRTPRTHQEKRAAATALEVDRLLKRGRIKRRQGRGLPTDWDLPNRRSEHSWKRHRATQWRK